MTDTPQEDGFELADPKPEYPKVIPTTASKGKQVSPAQLRLITQRLDKMDDLGVDLPAKYGHKRFKTYLEMSYTQADLFIQALWALMKPAKDLRAEAGRKKGRVDNFLEIPNYSRYLFDPLTFKVLKKSNNSPMTPTTTKTGVVRYKLQRDEYKVKGKTTFEYDPEVGRKLPVHTYEYFPSERRSVCIATVYRLVSGWTNEELEIDWGYEALSSEDSPYSDTNKPK